MSCNNGIIENIFTRHFAETLSNQKRHLDWLNTGLNAVMADVTKTGYTKLKNKWEILTSNLSSAFSVCVNAFSFSSIISLLFLQFCKILH